MTIYFTHPVFLWGAAALALAIGLGWRRSALDFSSARMLILAASRTLIVLAVIFALAGLTLGIPSTRREAIFLIDASRSIDDTARQKVEHFVDDVTSKDATLNVTRLYFAGRAANEASELTAEDKNSTNLEDALLTAFAAADPTCVSRVALFSDGLETEGDVSQIASESVVVSTIPLTTSEKPETQVSELILPERVSEGESFRVKAVVRSSVATTGKISFFQNGALVSSEEISVDVGENVYERDMTSNGKTKEIEVVATVETKDDTFVENNSASGLTLADGKPRVLVVASEPANLRNFVAALESQDLATEVRPIEGVPSEVVELESFDAIFFSDVPATALTLRQMEAIRAYVRDFGGGFLAAGGDSSFALGGYAKTPLDDALPLRSDFEKEKEKPSLAIALVIDRSGSMEGEKLELTKEAAKGVVELLSPRDFISVVAFDDAPRQVVPLQLVTSPSVIAETIGSIVSSGSTNVYAALNYAAEDLARANAKFKHIILLTDGKSAPGDYEKSIRKATDAEITVSTVGIGDCDRFLLEKLASDGSGRFYHCADARSTPQIFARETKLADRSALNEEPFLATSEVAELKMLEGVDFDVAPPLLGNVVAKPKTTCEIALTTEKGEPLLAHWRYGLGVAVAFTSDVDGRWSAEWFDWPDFSQFWAQIVRFAARSKDSNSSLTVALKGYTATVSLDLRDRYEQFLNDAETTTVVVDGAQNRRELPTPQRGPGFYQVSFSIEPGVKYALQTTSVKDGETLATQSRVFEAPEGRETDVAPTNEKVLREIAEKSAGAFNPTPEEFVASFANVGEAKVSKSLRGALLCVALLLFVFDVYLRRFNSYKIKN
ncbi:MAG: VWA domain-containing protein [Thermoguttaceae bacterium]|nr:VWA domain-containing protein [Thermoguttaceae bacterium]